VQPSDHPDFFAPAARSPDLHTAAARGELVLHYQPLLAARSLRLLGFEALVRWQPRDGSALRGPETFIASAEASGAIVQIGAWALAEACRQVSLWRQESGLDLSVSVNVSARQLEETSLLFEVRRALAASGLPPAALTLELTESIMVAPERVAAVHRLRRLGVRIALDDFGTGHSALSCLRKLPLDSIKIDRSFLEGLPDERGARLVFDAIVQLAWGLGLKTVVEGVESAAQQEYVEAAGCDLLQGFLFSRPLAFEAARRLLRDAA
jgi:EAL domain-containing protein (putative c-di-GMP-specific phosphodiesterase class I)